MLTDIMLRSQSQQTGMWSGIADCGLRITDYRMRIVRVLSRSAIRNPQSAIPFPAFYGPGFRDAYPDFGRTDSRRARGRLSHADAYAPDRAPAARAGNRRANLPQTREPSGHRRVQSSRGTELHEPLRAGALPRRSDHGHAWQSRAIGSAGREHLFDSRHDRRPLRQ